MTDVSRKTFTDSAGDDWPLAVTVASARRVRDEAGIDILEFTRGKPDVLERMLADEYTVCTVLWAVCRPLAESRDVDPEGFAERLASAEVIEAAVAALIEALIDFFPPRSRGPLRAVLAKMDRKIAAKRKQAGERAEAMLNDPQMDADLDALIDSQFSISASNSPASSE